MAKIITRTLRSFCENRAASFSECEKFRYTLSITWDDKLPTCQFIGLNPSTADEMKDDPTITRCRRFADSWGCGSLIMTNIFAYRATDPKDMINFKVSGGNPVGEMDGEENVNNRALIDVSNNSKLVIAAWGIHGRIDDRGKIVAALVGPGKLHSLGLTKDGHPKHPLYLKKNLQPVKYWPF